MKNQNKALNINYFNIKVCKSGFSGDGITYCDECGVSSANVNVKIVNGQNANEKSWPAVANIVRNGQNMC